MKKLALCTAVLACLPASAVTLGPDGMGQALIYPYYTVQSAGGDAFNTYLSVVNHTTQAKAVRVRFREGRLGREALSFNLFLSPNDVWTAAAVPTSNGTRLLTTDRSCTEPVFSGAGGSSPTFMDFRNDAFSGPNDDGAGTGLDRTREGFVEILEIATLTGTSAEFAAHNSAGVPSNCAALLATTPTVAAPKGGLSGTLTLINVANGLDFNVNAEALDDLARQPYFRRANDPYPDLNAVEIDSVSVVSANGVTYRSLWPTAADAVSAVLLRDHAMAEYVLDSTTASLTDVVMTFPTRHFHATATSAAPPFTKPAQWAPNCLAGSSFMGEPLSVFSFSREEQGASVGRDCGFPECPPLTPAPAACAASGVFSVQNNALTQFIGVTTERTAVVGSVTRGLGGGTSSGGVVNVLSTTAFQNGWLDVHPSATAALVSLAQSSLTRHSTGEQANGPHTFKGLPMVGFSVRIFRNGTLRCDAGACQGNYGGAFPMKYRRNIEPAS